MAHHRSRVRLHIAIQCCEPDESGMCETQLYVYYSPVVTLVVSSNLITLHRLNEVLSVKILTRHSTIRFYIVLEWEFE